jgi:hypothetical protein
MKIKDVVKLTALMLGREDVVGYLESDGQLTAGEDTLSTIDTMTKLVNLVISELATSYVPLTCSEEIIPTQGKVYFSKFKNNPLKVVSVSDGYGNNVNYNQYPEYMAVDRKVVVEYEYLPKDLGIEDAFPYEERVVPSRVLAYGVCAEVCIVEANFDQAVMWHKRYVCALEELLLPKNASLKTRRWL